MDFLQILHALCFALGLANCYNLETSHAIIYQVPDDDSEKSYFGMSVAIRPRAAALNNSWTIQIGAPRGTPEGSSVREPGTVYRCHSYGPCRMFPIDQEGSASGGYGVHQYKQKKDGAWIGVSMDVADFGTFERTVVCGHRWINENLKNAENIDVTYLMTGICYLQDLLNDPVEAPVQKLLPLVNRDKIYAPRPYVVDLSTYHWGLGQAGISVKLTVDFPGVLIGAPGVTHWIGSVIRYDETLHATVARFSSSDVARKNRYTYLGYSVASGRFYKDRELWYVAGAPRSANYHGEVFTFQLKGSSEEVRVQSNFVGATFGEYFGAALATVDLNRDSFDDLIVGAPLFSSKEPDEGRIYVYLGTGRGNFMVPSQVISGQAREGRFGSCISSMKDLDKDGYNDVVVGAPYEEKTGAIYIYRGFAKGLHTKHSQKILGRDIHPHLRGFGVSISAAVDVDGNKYEDIAVGSYLSGHVVLIRSRPVVSLHADIKTQTTGLIDRRDSHFNVTVCSRYAGPDAPDYVDVLRTIDIDPAHRRATLDLKTSAYKDSIRLRKNQITCELHSVLLNIPDNNYSPLQIAVKIQTSPCMDAKGRALIVGGQVAKSRDGFSKTCPVGSTAEYSRQVSFAGICGPDLTCRSDLRVSCAFPDSPSGSFILGSSDPLVLSIEIRNHGEPAYHTRIKIWSDLKLRLQGPENPAENTFWLDAGLLVETYRTNFSLQIDPDTLHEVDRRTRLNMIVEVFTSSFQSSFDKAKCVISLALRSQARLDFYASSSLASVYVTEKILRQRTLNVTHYYEVEKTGVTPLKNAELTIYIPEAEFLAIETETSEWMHLCDATEVPTGTGLERVAVLPEASNDRPPENRTVFVNCSSPETGCRIFKIFFLEGIPAGLSSYVKIIISLNMTGIELVKSEKDIVDVSTIGVLKWWEFFEGGPREVERSADVSIYKQERDAHVDVWVVALSVLAGGFVLCLIITGLARWNFFRRAKKQELEALRDAQESFVYFATAGKEIWPTDEPECT